MATAKQKAAIRKWQLAGAAARKHRNKTVTRQMQLMSKSIRQTKLFHTSIAKHLKLAKSGKSKGKAAGVLRSRILKMQMGRY